MQRTSSKWPAWSVIAARAAVLLLGLAALAVIGRVAAAHAASVGADAGDPVPVAVLEVPDASGPHLPPPPPPSEPAPPSPVLATPPPTSARATADDPVFVNYASAEQLRRLPGIGAKRADAIVALRAKMGRFQRVEDLLRVKGIGRATMRKLRPLVRFDLPEGGAQ